MDRTQKATTLFNRGFNCSQAVFAAFADPAKIEEATALKVASGFGGGTCCDCQEFVGPPQMPFIFKK